MRPGTARLVSPAVSAEPFGPVDIDRRGSWRCASSTSGRSRYRIATESDHAAWMSSIAHIRADARLRVLGLAAGRGMVSSTASGATQERHARDWGERSGFTCTVLRPGTEEVIGCLYIYPAKYDGCDAQVRAWVRADVAEQDGRLHAAVSRWLVNQLAIRARALRRPALAGSVRRRFAPESTKPDSRGPTGQWLVCTPPRTCAYGPYRHAQVVPILQQPHLTGERGAEAHDPSGASRQPWPDRPATCGAPVQRVEMPWHLDEDYNWRAGSIFHGLRPAMIGFW